MNDDNKISLAGLDGWETPLPLGWQTALPDFPVDALPGVIRDYVVGLATELQVPADLPGTVSIGMLAACSGGRLSVKVRRGWVEPSNLWVTPVLRPGSLKSAVVGKMRQPLADAEARLLEEAREGVLKARAEKKILTDYAETQQKIAAKDPTKANIEAAQKAVIAAEDVVVPEWPRLLASDSTPEKLVSLLAAGGGRIAAISAEAGIFTSLTGRHSKLPNLDIALQSHAGDAIRVDRLSRDPESVENPALTLIASVQPFALHEMTSRGDFAGRGLLARILWSLPKDNVGQRDIDAPAMHPVVQKNYEALMNDLAYSMATAESFVVELDTAAAAVFRNYRIAVERRLRPEGPLGGNAAREWGSKLCGAALRIAGALHAAGPDRHAPISEATMTAATRLGDYFQDHALAAFAAGDGNGDNPDARALLGYLIDKDLAVFKARDVLRKGPARLRKAKALTPVLDHLAEHGWIRPVEEGGFELHPRAAKFLREGCDSCDTCDSRGVPAGQCTCRDDSSLSHGAATPATAPNRDTAPVATVATECDTDATPEDASDLREHEGVATVAGVAEVDATTEPPATDLRQRARTDLTRGRRDPQPAEPDPGQEALIGGEQVAACNTCFKPTAQWVLDARDGRCITCAQKTKKEAS